MYQLAGERISEFNYRKIFGLSKQQMLEEPLEDYYLNTFIQTNYNKNEEYQSKRIEMEAKVRKPK